MKLKLHKTMRGAFPRFFSAKGEKKSSHVDNCKLEGNTEMEELDASISSSVASQGVRGKDLQVDDSEGRSEGCILDDCERNRIKPMMTRLDALQIQQKIQGMNHPDVRFALKHLARAHRRRGEYEQAKLVEDMLH
jgi:hypothetical protein